MRPHGASPAEALGKRLHRWGGEGWPEDLLVPPRPNLNRWGERVKQLVEAQPPPPNRHNGAGSEKGGVAGNTPYYAQGESRNTEGHGNKKQHTPQYKQHHTEVRALAGGAECASERAWAR